MKKYEIRAQEINNKAGEMWDARDRVESVYLDGLIKVYTENHYSLFLMTVHIIRPPYECLLETVFLFSQPKHDVGTHKNGLDELPGTFEHKNIGLN